MIAAAFIAAELAVSGTSPAELVFPAMLGVHALIGVGEALITAGALAFIGRVRPDLFLLRPDRATAETPAPAAVAA
jgi:cobalt/nickel transport system permease protein